MALRLGMVGCGRISRAHGIAAERIGDSVRFVACADVNEEAAKRFAETYRCDAVYADFVGMIVRERLDGIVITTWPAQHRDHVCQAIRAGARFILCEKALAMTGEEALEIWNAAQEVGATIVEGFMYTRHPAIARLDELVASERAGAVDTVRASFHLLLTDQDNGVLAWRQRKETGGAVPYDRTCYTVNACARYAGALPARVAATGTMSQRYGTITRLFGEITYENGCVGLIESSNDSVFSQELQVTCANRVFRLSTPFTMAGDATIYEYEALKFSHVREHKHEIKSPLPLQDDLPTYFAYQPQLEGFARAALGEAPPSPPLIESVVNSYTLDALVRSAFEDRVIHIDLPEALRCAWREHPRAAARTALASRPQSDQVRWARLADSAE